MRKLTITVGLPSSGKTSWARAYVADLLAEMMLTDTPDGVIRINRDDLRAMAHGGWIGHPAVEGQISIVQVTAVRELLMADCDVVVDDTNLAGHVRRMWLDLAKSTGAGFEVVDLTGVCLHECLARNGRRSKAERVPNEKIIKMYRDYIVPLGGHRILEAEPWLKG